MAICAFCEREMASGWSCTVEAFHADGRRIELVRYGDEDGADAPRAARCGDCRVERGGFHHPGCDLQQCPCCARQLLSCGCWFDEDDALDDDEWGDDGWALPTTPLGVDVNGFLLERGTIAGMDVIIHHGDVPDSDITTISGIRCTTALRTVIDLATEVEQDALDEMVSDAIERALFTQAEAWERLAQPDMAAHVGADLLRAALRRLG